MSPIRRFALLYGLLFALLIARRPDALTNPQFWAEDGVVFFRGQLMNPGLGILFQPHFGYLALAARLATAFASFFSSASVPLVMNLLALFIAALCCSLFALNRYRHLLASDGMRITLCVLMATAFQSGELIGNITCVHVFLFFAALLAILQPDESYSGRNAWSAYGIDAFGVLATLSDPLVVLLLPICAWRLIQARKMISGPAGVAVAAGVQLCVFWAANLPRATTARQSEVLAASLVAMVYRVLLTPMLGLAEAQKLAAGAFHAVLLIGIIALTAWLSILFLHSDASRRWKITACLYLILTSLVLAIGGRSLPIAFEGPALHWASERYFWAGSCLLAYLAALSIERWLPDREGIRTALLAVLFLGGIYGNFRVAPLVDYQWTRAAPVVDEWIGAKRAGRPRKAVSIPINPASWKLELPGQ